MSGGKDIEQIPKVISALGPKGVDALVVRNCFRGYADTLKAGGEIRPFTIGWSEADVVRLESV